MTGFLIVSPCRSGSTATAIAINEYCKTQNNNLAQHVLWYNSDIIHNFTKDHVYHSHQRNSIKNMPEDFTLIVNHRDPFDSTISRIVAGKLDKWHFYNNETIETKNIDLTIDLNFFLSYYTPLVEENIQLEKIASTVPHYKINYDDIKDNLKNIFKICNIDIDHEIAIWHKKMPVKGNLDYPNIIPNYGQLLDYAIERG